MRGKISRFVQDDAPRLAKNANSYFTHKDHSMTTFARRIRPFVQAELIAAHVHESRGEFTSAFHRLERAHVLGQASTLEHVRVHLAMLRWAIRQGDTRECLGQLLRILGAATKTAWGAVPRGNTGGANVSPLKPMSIPPDLQVLIDAAG